MANLLRTRKAKSASSWSDNDLKAFNISIVPTDIPTFFGVEELPSSPFANSVILNSLCGPPPNNRDGLSEDEANFFFYLSAVEDAEPMRSAIGDLASFFLRFFRFSSKDRFIRQRPKMHLQMSWKTVDAIADVALVDRSYFLLLVQEDKVGINHVLYTESVSH
jgi:hypothetical protein